MPSKSVKRKAIAVRKSPVRRTPIRKTGAKTTRTKVLRPRPEFSREEVETLSAQLERHQQSERAWQRLTALPAERDDGWAAVEEHLLDKSRQEEHAERRWKYFA